MLTIRSIIKSFKFPNHVFLQTMRVHNADRCCINSDNWNIFHQHNWNNYARFFCCHDDNKNEAVEAHIPRNPDSKTKKSRHRDSKTKKPRHLVPAEFWPWCPLIAICRGNLPHLFAVAIFLGDLPQLFAVGICRSYLQ